MAMKLALFQRQFTAEIARAYAACPIPVSRGGGLAPPHVFIEGSPLDEEMTRWPAAAEGEMTDSSISRLYYDCYINL